MMSSTSTDLYMNMSQFSDMRLAAREHDASASKAVAQQFEGLFIQMMLKNMRTAAQVDDGQHSSYMDFYTDMYDKQLSQTLSSNGGIGIAKVLLRQMDPQSLERQQTAAEDGKTLPVYRLALQQSTSLPITVMDYSSTNPSVKAYQLQANHAASNSRAVAAAETVVNNALLSETIEPFYGWNRADHFVRDLWPHAATAAADLGVSTAVLVAQAALETGWGKHAMKKTDGSVAFNLFGIKAGADWNGQSVHHSTLEYREGAMQREQASFRAYESVSESMQDYVDFVKSSARYAEALQHQGSDAHYVRGLQQGGYATDPAYADKIINIMQGQTFNDSLASLADSRHVLS